MLINKSLVNNELIGAISIYSILLHLNKISLSKAVLIIPFTSHKETLNFLKNNNTTVRSLEELILKKPDCFASFNERYYSFLPVTINSILLLKELDMISFNNDYIQLNSNKIVDISKINLGKKGVNIVQSSVKLARILTDEDKNLYLQLRVQI